ncbi:hypothetical protein D3C81_1300730 [compost metagenome]
MLPGFIEDDIALFIDKQNIPFLQRRCFPENLIKQIRFNINDEVADILKGIIVFDDSGLYKHRISGGFRAVLPGT